MKLLMAALLAFAASARVVLRSGFARGPHPGVLAAADLNQDSRPDLIVANFEDGTVTILLIDGGGRFHTAAGSPFVCGASPNDIAAADFNRDGHADLAIVNTQTPFLTILLGDGRGGFRDASG
jgi:hypothetical protein